MDIGLLNTTFEKTENPGMDIFDSRLEEITTLSQNGEYLRAAVQAETILAEGTYDIRIIGFFLYGVFLEQGLDSLFDIFQGMIHLLAENMEAVGPVKNRDKQTQVSFNLFFKQLLKKIKIEEEKNSDNWRMWIDTVHADRISASLDAADELKQVMTEVLETAADPLVEVLMNIMEWLEAFHQLVYKEPDPEPELDMAPEPEPADEFDIYESPPETEPVTIHADRMTVQGSFYLDELIKKIDVFEQLVGMQKFANASLLADDILAILNNFDYKKYFPKLFSKFSFLKATNIDMLGSFDMYKDTMEWQAMKNLYQVDIDSFSTIQFDAVDEDSPRVDTRGFDDNLAEDVYDEWEEEIEPGDSISNDEDDVDDYDAEYEEEYDEDDDDDEDW